MGTTAEKLAYLKDSKEQIKNVLETPYNVMRDYSTLIKKYIDNQPTNTVNDGICTNALDVPLVSLVVDGNSEQGENPSPENPQDIEVIDGVNLFDKNNPNLKYDMRISSDGFDYYIDADGYFTSNFIPVHKGEKYYKNSPKEDAYNRVAFYTSDNLYTYVSKSESNEFVIPNNANYLRFCGLQTEIDTTQLIKGTTPKLYLPYGHIGLRQSGKNIIGLKDTEGTINGLNYEVKNGVITLNGVLTDNISNYTITTVDLNNAIDFNTATHKMKWYYEGSIPSGSGNTIGIGVYYYNYLDFNNGNTVTNNRIINVNDTIKLNIDNGKGFVFNNVKIKLMIIEGTEIPTDYEPYHEPKIIPINLNGNTLSKVGDVKDLLKIYRNGEVEIEDKIKHIASYNGETITTDYMSTTGQLTTGAEVYYVGNTETIKLPSIDPIQLWEGTNNFELITNLDTTFEIEYIINKNN